MKDDEFAIVANYLWEREVDLFTKRVYTTLDEYFDSIIERGKNIDTDEAFIFVRARLQQDPEERPYFDHIYNNGFDYYIKYLLPSLINEGTQGHEARR